MAKNGRKVRKIAKALGASRVVRIRKGWDWKMASPAERKLCVCGNAAKHLPHCPYNEVGVDFSDMQKVLKKLEKDYSVRNEPRSPKRIPKILKAFEEIWVKYPDLRLCQLIVNAIHEGSLYHCEDEELIKLLRKFYSKKNRHV